MVLTPEMISFGISALIAIGTVVAVQKGWIKPPAPKPVVPPVPPPAPPVPVDPNLPPVGPGPAPILPHNPILDSLLKLLMELASRKVMAHDPVAQALAQDHEERLIRLEGVEEERMQKEKK